MKAKDTEMNKEQIDALLDTIGYGEAIKEGALFTYEHEINRLFRKEQAKISFKAGQEGERERIFKALESELGFVVAPLHKGDPDTVYFQMNKDEWDAFITEKGLNNIRTYSVKSGRPSSKNGG